jgi:phage FluMu gp28-like protein
MFYVDVFYYAGGYRRVRGLSSAQRNLRSRQLHLCFDAISLREAEPSASSAVQ